VVGDLTRDNAMALWIRGMTEDRAAKSTDCAGRPRFDKFQSTELVLT